jgi:hypothetical protein
MIILVMANIEIIKRPGASKDDIHWCVENMWHILRDEVPRDETIDTWTEKLNNKGKHDFYRVCEGDNVVSFALIRVYFHYHNHLYGNPHF